VAAVKELVAAQDRRCSTGDTHNDRHDDDNRGHRHRDYNDRRRALLHGDAGTGAVQLNTDVITNCRT